MKKHLPACGCAYCNKRKPFTPPEHLISSMAAGNVVVFVGAGVSTENPVYCQSTLYDEIRHEIGLADTPSFPKLMSTYCKQPDGRLKLLGKIRERIDYFLSFDDLYRPMAKFHRSIAPLHMITDVVTTNWDDLFQQECNFSPFIYDSDMAFWDAAKRRVMKIHGSISNFGSIVATEEDYTLSYRRLNNGPLGAQLKSLIARKTIIYVGYSLSDDNYVRLLRNIAQMMQGNIRQSYFVSPDISPSKLAKAPIPLIPIETDGTFFFENMREHLADQCGIIDEEAFLACDILLDDIADKHDKSAAAFIKTQHPLLIFILGYQDGLVHALQRIARMRRTGEYYSAAAVHNRMHGYDQKIIEFVEKNDFWNASYAEGYQNGLLFLLLHHSRQRKVKPPPVFHTPLDYEFKSLASVLRFPIADIPKALAACAKRILKTLPADAQLVPDHTPFL